MHNFFLAVENTTTLLVFSYNGEISVGHENTHFPRERVTGKEREN